MDSEKDSETVVVGLDLSLTASGVIGFNSKMEMTQEVVWGNKKWLGVNRLAMLEDTLTAFIRTNKNVKLYVVEGYAFNRFNGMAAIGEWGGICRLRLHREGKQFITVPPKRLKKFVTGNGNAGKPLMAVGAMKKWGYEKDDDNLVDAYGLAAIGFHCIHDDKIDTLTQYEKEVIEELRIRID